MHVVVQQIRHAFHTMMHPFKGFWDAKNEGLGSVWTAIAMLFALAVVINVNRQFAGFTVNFMNPKKLNSIDEIIYVVFPFLLWCISNWLVTTLMDGEGRFGDIVMASGYALLPIVVANVPMTIISRFMTTQEASFYYFFITLSYVWFGWLLFVGIMTVHQYTVTKTVITSLLTLIVMGIIIFLLLLFFNLIQQVAAFVSTVYQELIFRM